jgi:hypothetical protein
MWNKYMLKYINNNFQLNDLWCIFHCIKHCACKLLISNNKTSQKIFYPCVDITQFSVYAQTWKGKLFSSFVNKQILANQVDLSKIPDKFCHAAGRGHRQHTKQKTDW